MKALKLAKTLARRRKAKSMTQEEIAQLCGVSFQTINRWESGKFLPSKLAQEKIKKVLELL